MKEEMKKKVCKDVDLATMANVQVGETPIMKGQVLTFQQKEGLVHPVTREINGVSQTWNVVDSDEGYEVSLKQLLRNHNGLGLGRGTQAEVFDKFLALFPDDGKPLVLKVANVKKIESSFSDGKQSYYIFAKA